jgi:mRNA interferase RelE/StbE
MTYRVTVSNSAERQLSRLDRQTQERIRDRIDSLADNPRPHGVKKLRSREDQWRIRVGDWRIVYTVQDDRLIVLIVRIGHRSDVYG